MKCGHTANGYLNEGKVKRPVCVSCCGLVAGAEEVADEQPVLENRVAKCCYNCEATQPSSNYANLPFFEYRPEHDYDLFYCGCFGWD